MKYWDPAIERIPPEELKDLQYKLLKTLVYRLYNFSPFYREKLKKAEVKPDDIQKLGDITKLPFTDKRDLRDNYPDKMFNVSQTSVVRYHISSGTSGKPIIVGYTDHDLDQWSEALARSLTACGLGRGDIIQVSYGYGLFTGGLGLHYGAERIGASVLPTSTGNTERQIELMRDMRVTAIACTPSYLLHISETAKKMGVSIKDDTCLKVGVLGAEPWSDKMRNKLEEGLGIKAYDIYGASELSGPLFTECQEQNGFHVWGDQMLLEIVDPETGETLENGEEGELAVTTLQKEALPLLRYRIGDITRIDHEVCSCGRTHPRISRIKGRTDDMLIVRGINVFPSQIEHVLMSVDGVGNHFQIVVDRKGALDRMLVMVEVGDKAFSDKIQDLISLKDEVGIKLHTVLNINVDVELVEPGTLPRFERKAKRVIDRREL